jgi:hypothetical protein
MKFPGLAQFLILCWLLCLSASLHEARPQASPAKAKPAAAAPRAPHAALVFVQAPKIAAAGLAFRFPEGSRIVRSAPGRESAEPANLTAEFFAAADPQISFDATRILFAGQVKQGDHWQIWEMELDGSSKRQITHLDADCLRPAYHARDLIVFTVSEARGSQVYVANLDGTDARPITFGPGNFQVETVLKDGRILVSAASPLVPDAGGSGGLYVLRHDGSGLTSLRCEHQQRTRRTEAAELSDGSIVFVKNTPSATGVGGELAMIRRGALHNSALSPQATLAWSPRPLDDKSFIVARRNAAANSRFDLYAFDPATGRFSPAVVQDSKHSSVQAVPVASHDVPRWYWSTLNPKDTAGYFVCLDARQSADEPGGIIPARFDRVRVLILENGKERSLGEAAVEADGSFYIGVPADQPVRFELLDAAGTVVRAQQSWIWARAGEERGCVGCHEDKSVAPENRWPMALRRFDTPVRLGVEAEPARAAH